MTLQFGGFGLTQAWSSDLSTSASGMLVSSSALFPETRIS